MEMCKRASLESTYMLLNQIIFKHIYALGANAVPVQEPCSLERQLQPNTLNNR